MILAILIFVTEVITRYWIKQLTRVSVQIHFFRRRQKVIGHFIFSSKIPRRDQNPDSKSDGSSDRFMDRSTTSGQFTRTLPVSDYWTRIHTWPNQGFLVQLNPYWKTHPNIFPKFWFSGGDPQRFLESSSIVFDNRFQKTGWLMTRKFVNKG